MAATVAVALVLRVPLPAALASIVGCLVACIAVHELGHLLAARLAGFRILLFSVGPLRWQRRPDGTTRLGFAPMRVLGQCLASPARDDRLRARFTAYLAGGPLAGLAFAAMCGAVVVLSAPHTMPRKLAAVALMMGLLLNLVSLVPMASSTDGFCLRTLLRGDQRAAQFVAVFTVSLRDMAGIAPSALLPALRADLSRPAVAPLWDVAGRQMLYYALLAEDRIAEAGVELTRVEVLSRDGMARTFSRRAALLELAWFAAEHERDAAAAQAWLDELASLPRDPSRLPPDDVARLRAETAISLAAGRFDDARAMLATLPAVVTASDPSIRTATWQIRLRSAHSLSERLSTKESARSVSG